MSHVVEVTVVGPAPVGGVEIEPDGQTPTVLYCDVCRRWGRLGTTHLCGSTWCETLAGLLIAIRLEALGEKAVAP